ncbi:ECF transporter S component [Enterococcus villorum]|uniref:ECF transporter S component n=1 Tax=Enterococcus villorum TaxID=112904 RepID=A0A1V8YFP3_9ENTE|nr:ECF transporter S component [Enterococcus villorum]OQO71435.1 ECF transporter S component [Enterococcus villorum]OQO76610.1 ECF transporter S component [Enterococcus villorum]
MLTTKRLTVYAMMIALTVALSLTILIPIPATNGFVTLCEVGIYTAASLFGPIGGLVVGASSGLLIDLLSGYPQWAIFSLLIHGLQGFICGYFAKNSVKNWIVGLILGSIVMIIGYFLAGWFLYDWPAGVASLPGNFFQNIVGIGLTFPLTQTIQRTVLKKRFIK